MKVLFDTNVLIAAFISRGVCHELFDYSLINHKIFVSKWIIDEFYEHMIHKFKFSKSKVEQLLNFIYDNTTMLGYSKLPSRICRDPEDDKILAAAINGNVDCIISGDEDLLSLKKFQGIPIIKPAQFWKFEKELIST